MVETKGLVILEGFDMVGKSTFAKQMLKGHKIYHANHDLTDITVGRDSSWVIGYGVLDFLQQTGCPDPVVIDRGVPSSYVYQTIYGSDGLSPEIIDWYSKSEYFKGLSHIYVRHRNKETAREIYEASASREKNPNELSNKYDQFESFDAYWERYILADKLFMRVYDKLGITPRIFETVPNSGWEEVPPCE